MTVATPVRNTRLHLTTPTQCPLYSRRDQNLSTHRAAPIHHVRILARARAVLQRSSLIWLRSISPGPYPASDNQLVHRLGLTSRGGYPSLATSNGMDVPDGFLPPLPPCDSPVADMADIRAPCDFRRRHTRRVQSPYLDAWIQSTWWMAVLPLPAKGPPCQIV